MLEMEAAGIGRYTRWGDRLWTQCHVMQGTETDSGHSAMHFLRMNMDLCISVTTSHGSVL